MNCLKCNGSETQVVDSRPYTKSVRRRRQCPVCGYRFTTVETGGDTMKRLIAQRKKLIRQVQLLQLRITRFLIVVDSVDTKDEEELVIIHPRKEFDNG